MFRGKEIRLEWDLTQGITDDGRLYVGGRAGPSVELSNLCHEMAHFVEIDDARCAVRGWGLRLPEVWIYDRMCIEPTTYQATERECRVAALQHSLLGYIGHPLSPRRLVSAFHYLPDWFMVPCRPHVRRTSLKTTDKERLKWCEDRVTSLIAKPEYQIDYFMHEWNRKCQLLNQVTPAS